MNNHSALLSDFDQLLIADNENATNNFLQTAPLELLAKLYGKLAQHILKSNEQFQDVDLLLQQTGKFRPIINSAMTKLIELYQTHGELISAQNEAIASACKTLLKVQYKAHAIILDHARQNVAKKGLLAVSIHRIMMIQLYLHLIAYIKYNAIADKEWLNLHRLFIIAERNELTLFAVTDDSCFIKKSVSISDLYTYSLLMGCASLHSLNSDAILKALLFVIEKANLVSINDQSHGTENEIVVDIATGFAPNFLHFYTQTANSVFRYLHLEKMLDAITKQRTDTSVFNKTSLTEDLKAHLIKAWSKFYLREIRQPVSKTIEATIGFSNIHYYLCGGKNLVDFLGEGINLSISYRDDEMISLIEQQRSGDVWSPGLTNPIGKLLEDELPEAFEFQRHFELNSNNNNHEMDHPKLNIKMIDQSQHGCCLELPKSELFKIIIGDLIGFRDAEINSHWQLGVMSWVKIIEEKLIHVGINILGTETIPLGLEIPLSYGANKNCTEAILIPFESTLKLRTSLLLKENFLREGECVKIVQKGLSKDLKLTNKLHQCEHFFQFNCGFYSLEKSNEPDNIERLYTDYN